MADSNKKGTSFGTILTAGLLGAALAILFVPYRKNEVRNKTITKTQGFMDFLTRKFKSTADEIIDKTEKIMNSQKSKAENINSEAKEKLEKAKA